MKFLDIRERLIQIDVEAARNFNGSDSLKEYLKRLADTVEELLHENKMLREVAGVTEDWWTCK